MELVRARFGWVAVVVTVAMVAVLGGPLLDQKRADASAPTYITPPSYTPPPVDVPIELVTAGGGSSYVGFTGSTEACVVLSEGTCAAPLALLFVGMGIAVGTFKTLAWLRGEGENATEPTVQLGFKLRTSGWRPCPQLQSIVSTLPPSEWLNYSDGTDGHPPTESCNLVITAGQAGHEGESDTRTVCTTLSHAYDSLDQVTGVDETPQECKQLSVDDAGAAQVFVIGRNCADGDFACGTEPGDTVRVCEGYLDTCPTNASALVDKTALDPRVDEWGNLFYTSTLVQCYNNTTHVTLSLHNYSQPYFASQASKNPVKFPLCAVGWVATLITASSIPVGDYHPALGVGIVHYQTKWTATDPYHYPICMEVGSHCLPMHRDNFNRCQWGTEYLPTEWCQHTITEHPLSDLAALALSVAPAFLPQLRPTPTITQQPQAKTAVAPLPAWTVPDTVTPPITEPATTAPPSTTPQETPTTVPAGATDFGTDGHPQSGAECYPTGWAAFNPVEWVLKPVICALKWAFIPHTDVQAEFLSLKDEMTGKAPVYYASVAPALITTFGNGLVYGSGCEHMPDFSFAHDGSGELPCAPPDSEAWQACYGLMVFFVILTTALAVWQISLEALSGGGGGE